MKLNFTIFLILALILLIGGVNGQQFPNPLNNQGFCDPSFASIDLNKLPKYIIETDHLIIELPENEKLKKNINGIPELYEAIYQYESEILNEKLDDKIHVKFEVYDPQAKYAGYASSNLINIPVNSFCSVSYVTTFGHECGHSIPGSPSQDKKIQSLPPYFNEGFAQILLINAVENVYGEEIGSKIVKSVHYEPFYVYTKDKKATLTSQNFDDIYKQTQIQRRATLDAIDYTPAFSFLQYKYGFSSIQKTYNYWLKNTEIKDYLKDNGFSDEETMIVLFSVTVNENINWIFKEVKSNVADERINAGIKLVNEIPPQKVNSLPQCNIVGTWDWGWGPDNQISDTLQFSANGSFYDMRRGYSYQGYWRLTDQNDQVYRITWTTRGTTDTMRLSSSCMDLEGKNNNELRIFGIRKLDPSHSVQTTILSPNNSIPVINVPFGLEVSVFAIGIGMFLLKKKP